MEDAISHAEKYWKSLSESEKSKFLEFIDASAEKSDDITENATLLKQSLQSDADIRIGQPLLDYTLNVLASYLICQGKDNEARALLDEDPIPTADWYYLNALLRFRELGDCIESRSALSVAFEESPVVALTLTGHENELGEEDELDEQDESMWEGDEDHAFVTQPAWQKTAGALAWMTKGMETEYKMFGASDMIDEVRVRKWQREVETASAHFRRQDLKSTKKAFKTALREAESLNDGGEMYLLTAKMLGNVLMESEDSLEDLRTTFAKKIAWLDQQESEDFESLFTSYSEFSEILYELGMDKEAGHCVQKALTYFEKAMNRGTENLDFHHKAEYLFIHACVLSQEEKFEEAERCFSELIAIQEKYLGVGHLSLIDGLMGWRFCLHNLNRHDEEKLIHDRLVSIDKNFDADDEYRFVCDAALVKAD